MHLTALVEHAEHVCCRYRLAAFRSELEQAGHRLELRPLPRHWWDWLRLSRQLRRVDAVILQRKLPRAWQRFLLRRAAPFLIFDYDDAVFLRDSYARRGIASARRVRRFAGLMHVVDAVTAGNTFLAEQAARWAGSGKVHVVPTCVNPSLYPLAAHARAGAGVELVWVGSSSTLRGLEAVRPLLEEIGRRVPGICLKLVCDRILCLDHLAVELCPWNEAGEAAALAGADIGIAHVPDDLWSQGKCGLKILQYMAAGLPVIANPVGVQAEIVQHGKTGFLVESADEWVQAVVRLSGNPGLRRRMGAAGRRRLEQNYSVARGAAGWLELLRPLRSQHQAA